MKKLSFDDILSEVENKNKFNELKFESHHGITRYMHVMRVSKHTYRLSRVLHFDYKSATRAALLHDYFTEEDFKGTKGIKKGIYHPSIAYLNASKDFNLNKKERNAIEAHMFPLGKKVPKYKESWLLTIVDKLVATYEYLNFKFRYAVLAKALMVLNIIFLNSRY